MLAALVIAWCQTDCHEQRGPSRRHAAKTAASPLPTPLKTRSRRRAGSRHGGALRGPGHSWNDTSTARRPRRFREVRQARPGLDPRRDQPGDRPAQRDRRKAEEAKKAARRRRARATSTKPSTLLDRSHRARSRNPYAHFCRGIILEQQGDLAEAHQHFKRVTELDPHDADRLVLGRRARLPTPTTRAPGGPEAGQGADRALTPRPWTATPT